MSNMSFFVFFLLGFTSALENVSPPKLEEAKYVYETQYFDRQRVRQDAACFVLRKVNNRYRFFLSEPLQVDHFSFSNDDVFKQRYLLNDSYWQPGGPIFIYTGNEGDVEAFAQNTVRA